MSRPPCAEFAELRSAYLDGALGGQDRERLLAHLAGCDRCRAEISELRALRELLSRVSRTSAPADLSSRLVSIAGPQAAEPLWSRPFRRTRHGVLPSRRRIKRLRAGAAGLTVGTAVAMAGVIGYVAAPSRQLTSIDDPTDDAQAAFTSTLDQFPLTGDALTAVLQADVRNLRSAGSSPAAGTLGASEVAAGQPEAPVGAPLNAAESAAAMQRSAATAATVTYSGRQQFSVRRDQNLMTATVEVVRNEYGSQVKVLSQSGRELLRGFRPAVLSSRLVDGEVLQLLEDNYILSGVRGGTVAGRTATMISASQDGRLAARWWLDDETGIVLWEQTYDQAGALVMSFGFVNVTVSDDEMLAHLAPRLSVPITNTSMSLASADVLGRDDWACSATLAGLSLVRLRADRAQDPHAVHLVYSDGLNTVSVFEQRGRLDGVPAGGRWQPASGAYVRGGAAPAAIWQAGDVVFTVVTDGSSDLLARSVAQLPRGSAHHPTTMDQVKEGWVKILADAKG